MNLSVVVQFVSFLIFFLLMKRFVFDVLQQVLSKRQAELEDLNKTAQSLQTQAEGLWAEYRERIRGAQERASELLDKKLAEAANEAQESLKRSRQEVNGLREAAKAELEREKEAVLKQLRTQVDDLASDVVTTVLG